MRLSKPLALAVLVLGAQLSMLATDVAVLRNGFSIRHDRREEIGDVTRLYTSDGYVDIPTDQIASFEVEETPSPPTQESPSQQPQVTAPAATLLPIAASSKVDIDALVREASFRRRLDPDFVNSVIKAESNFQLHAVSPKGAQGLMQLMPQTAAKLGVSDPFDPKANVEAGTAYLSDLLDLYHNDPIKALAAYNAGPQRVDQYHGVPPYHETRSYIARIVRDFNAKKRTRMAQTRTAQNQQKPATSRQRALPTTSKKKSNRVKTRQASISVPQTASGTQ